LTILRIFSLLLFLFASPSFVISQCAVDVTILEGSAISMCVNAPETITASNGYVSYAWSGPEALTGQSIVPSFSGTYQVDAVDGVGCVSSASITVTINPIPVDNINSSEGSVLCPGSSGSILSVNSAYPLYQWSTGATTSTINVTQPGNYEVAVADNNGCVALFDYTLTAVNFELIVTQNGGCGSGSVALTASGGTSYFWSTGETGSTIVVSPASPTVFSVTVTNGGCVQQLSAVAEVVNDIPEYEMEDTIYIAAGDEQYILGPEGFDTYYWSPSSFVSDSTAQGVYFEGDSTQMLYVMATSAEGCIVYDSVLVVVVRLTIPNAFSPNQDQINDSFVIPELYELPGELFVFNRYGDLVFDAERYENNWFGNCDSRSCMGGGQLPEGTYFYEINVKGIKFKGFLTLKRSL
jgi:gliding motility-associated-like protein